MGETEAHLIVEFKDIKAVKLVANCKEFLSLFCNLLCQFLSLSQCLTCNAEDKILLHTCIVQHNS